MERPLVSIITPVLNRVETMETCLASIAAQTYQEIEHIVVDGGSTDGTLELLGAYRAPHQFRVISESDNGMYDAINKGISLARGDVFAYINSDDLYLPWSVEVAVDGLRDGADLVYGDLAVVHRMSGLPAFHIQFYPAFDLRHYAFVGTMGQPTVFWSRRLSDKIGLFDLSYRLIGDCDYWLRAALSGSTPRHIPEVMAVQREHGSTLRETESSRLRTEFETLRQKMTKVVDPPASPRWEWFKKRMAWRVRQLEFFYEMKARHPKRWRRFVNTLHAHEIDVRVRDLRMLAPARWRGGASLFGNPGSVVKILGCSDQL